MNYFGYVSPYAFEIGLPSVPNQNIILRDRAKKLGTNYGLGVGEIFIKDLYFGFYQTILISNENSYIGLVDKLLLPPQEWKMWPEINQLIMQKSLIIDICPE